MSNGRDEGLEDLTWILNIPRVLQKKMLDFLKREREREREKENWRLKKSQELLQELLESLHNFSVQRWGQPMTKKVQKRFFS